MINLNTLVPAVYPSASRDFQYVSRLINIVLNDVKHNVDSLYNLPVATENTKLTELLALTLGFKVKRNYNQKQLIAIVTVLPSILRHKGTLHAVDIAVDALVKASGASGDPGCSTNGTQLEITLPENLIDVTLLLDLLDYILPCGMTVRIKRINQTEHKFTDRVKQHDKIQLQVHYDLDRFDNRDDGLSVLAELSNSYNESGSNNVFNKNAEFSSNFKLYGYETDTENCVLNAGLLSNTVIPMLAGADVPDDTDSRYALYSSDGKRLKVRTDTPAEAEIALYAKKLIK